MAITSTSTVGTDTAATAATATATTGTSNADSEKRFLKLLVTQLNNQDPLNPMDNAELTSQLAQMSTVSGIEQLNTTLSGLVSQSSSSQVLQAASLIGNAVLSPGNALSLQMSTDSAGTKTPQDVPFAVELPANGATDVTVTITDANGTKVRTMELGALGEGANGVKWDGKNDAGEVVAEGNYQFSVKATGAGANVSATALTFTQVAAVKQGSSGVTLELSTGKSIALSDVRMFL
ncbi:flagellar hook assembly protein FlgD [Variovorax sp. N23]|uniref:flagellar hook assembly protein FlgD n=1 Tax=Variovorax sp. N23 TaxID=2980555 RepID=UPI0021C7FBF4|nr:flagellar hook assembly protein FlgD [Variovorax sp. N23]MCU4118014.1 flagellar hook assembly protein FlgD [Variovorax sp. N23]